MGTLGPIASETIAGAPGTTKADVFAFGVILYEMLAGPSGKTGTGRTIPKAVSLSIRKLMKTCW
jgi:serine/threonine protein kinase